MLDKYLNKAKETLNINDEQIQNIKEKTTEAIHNTKDKLDEIKDSKKYKNLKKDSLYVYAKTKKTVADFSKSEEYANFRNDVAFLVNKSEENQKIYMKP